MKVKTIQEFYDLEKETLRKVDDTFEVTQDRFQEVQRYVQEVKTTKKK